MKNYISLFLFLGVGFGKKIASNEFGDRLNNFTSNYPYLHGYSFNNASNFKFFIDAGNPDINAKIMRPCEIYDTFCIRRFFAEHSKCRISAEPVPEPLYRAQTTLNVPSLNFSATFVNVEYRGIPTGKIEEFYVNKETNNLVIMLGFDFISLNGYAYLKFYRPGREPTITSDNASITFGRMSITLVIPQVKNLRLDKANISTFLYVPTYNFTAGPGTIPTDPQLLATYNLVAVNRRVNEQEFFLTEGHFIAATFMQYNICDFGLKIV